MYTLGFPFRPWRGRDVDRDRGGDPRLRAETAHDQGVTERMHFGAARRAARVVLDRRAVDRHRPHPRRAGAAHARGSSTWRPATSPTRPATSSTSPARRTSPATWCTRRPGPRRCRVAGRRVVVVGSGATAITLLPALVDEGAAHVTMLQRSPSYVASLPSRDVVADGLRAVLPDAVAHRLVRGKNVLLSSAGYQVLRRHPDAGRRMLRRRALRLPARRLPGRHPLRAALRPVGPAAVRGPRRRPVRRAVRTVGPTS